MKKTDVTIKDVKLVFLPVTTRVPLKFGSGVVTSVTCARVRVTVESKAGKTSFGWGETPLSVQWVWPSNIDYDRREQALMAFCKLIAQKWIGDASSGHPMEIGYDYIKDGLMKLADNFNRESSLEEPMPYLAALVCFSAFDIALHDAFANANDIFIYDAYDSTFMNRDLADYMQAEQGAGVNFQGLYPCNYLIKPKKSELTAWHLVGGKDPLFDASEGQDPNDGYPFILSDWIKTDGLTCLKIKLTGTDPTWDYKRWIDVGNIACEHNVHWLSADFNCQVTDCDYVNDMLDRLILEHPLIYAKTLYIEQPFPYELEDYKIDVRSVSARKPLFMDESAHDWQMVKLGRSLGWSGVALKTCKTQTGALLSLCWAKAHGMTLMVQDLTNPMLAQIPHVLLAAHADTIMGVETNAMQFYPKASLAEEKIHPGLYKRRNGKISFDTLGKIGFGYRNDEVQRSLPEWVK